MKSIASVLIILFVLSVFEVNAQQDSAKVTQEEQDITLQVKGMACDLCAQSLKNSLSELEGISIQEINPKEGLRSYPLKEKNYRTTIN